MPRNPRAHSGDFDEAAAIFDRVCRMLDKTDEEIGLLLGGASRHAIASWRGRRATTTPVPFGVMLAACRLAGYAITPSSAMRPGGPQLYGLVPLADEAELAAGAEQQRIRVAHRRQVRLRVCFGGLGIAAVLVLIGTSNSFNPRDWGRDLQRIVESITTPRGGGGSSPIAVRPPPGDDPMVPVSSSAPASPGAGDILPVPAPSPIATDRGGSGGAVADAGAAPVDVAVDAGPAAASPPPPGVGGTSNPRAAGGMTGTLKEGPVYAGGTTDGKGIRGCVGADAKVTQNLSVCGALNIPGDPLPLPVLPAPTDITGQPPQPPWTP